MIWADVSSRAAPAPGNYHSTTAAIGTPATVDDKYSKDEHNQAARNMAITSLHIGARTP